MKVSAGNHRCEKCGGALVTRTLPEYRNDVLMGLPGVVILNAVEEVRCQKCGHVAATGFSDLEGLLAAVAVARVTAPQKLSGRDVRFLRKALGWLSRNLRQNLKFATKPSRDGRMAGAGWTDQRKALAADRRAIPGRKGSGYRDRREAYRLDAYPDRPPVARPVEMRFRAVDMKVARRRERVWKQVGQAA